MEVASPRPKQARLFDPEGPWTDKPLAHWRQATHIVGDFFEEATAQLVNGERLQTRAGKVCPDVQTSHAYYESKAMARKGGHVLLYAHKLPKYAEIAEASTRTLFYVFWIHAVKAKECPTRDILRDSLAQTVQEAYVVWYPIVHAITGQVEAEDYTACGYPSPFYRYHRTDLKKLRRIGNGNRLKLTVYGRELCEFTLFEIALEQT